MRQRLVLLSLLYENMPEVHDAENQEKGVKAYEHVSFHYVDHVLRHRKSGLLSV